MKNILITGGAGFIGSNFVEYFYDNFPDYSITVLDQLTYAGRPENIPDRIRSDKKRYTFWYGNVCNADMVDSLISKANWVVHFAAESHVARSIFDNRIFFETDVIGTYTICNSILKHRERIEKFIHISTSEVYGTCIGNPMTEEHPLNPMSPYASAKCGADRLVYSYVATYDLPFLIVRPFNQYGPKQHLEKLIPRFITSALMGQPLTVHGKGEALRDWLFVEDTCDRIGTILKTDFDKIKGEVVNIGSGYEKSVIDIARIILDITNKSHDLITHIGDRPGNVDRHISSTQKAKDLFGILPGRDFEQGLKQTIDWYSENKKWWERIEWMKHVPIKTSSGKVELH